ncbi:hypothetical protein LTR78_003308 [Recurvomyces mirabilis]|uniref:Uncharacterized protein n=1 Tax=Recurvomyces mirabilis TaxID=574656 RepID=A0AAE1C3U9_9PEZI|nr:hypothetical protein LTR78_003308 [Recurvomyces mirabilis]KAK5156875.1 hypothetical protein LTS14_004392 [Recurvomyces mirabilis]
MSRYNSRYDDDEGYSSSDSTLVNERQRRPAPTRPRQSRYRTPSSSRSRSRSRSRSPPPRPRTSYHHDDTHSTRSARTAETPGSGGSKFDTLGKATIAIGIISVLSGLLQIWNTKKTAERERQDKRRRREMFERSKVQRRREEAKVEDERRRRRDRARWEEERSEVSDVRRIGYAGRAREEESLPRQIRMIEGGEGEGEGGGGGRRRGGVGDDVGYEDDYRSRRGR